MPLGIFTCPHREAFPKCGVLQGWRYPGQCWSERTRSVGDANKDISSEEPATLLEYGT